MLPALFIARSTTVAERSGPPRTVRLTPQQGAENHMKTRLAVLLSLAGLLILTINGPALAQESAGDDGGPPTDDSGDPTAAAATTGDGRQQLAQAAAVDPAVTIRGAGATFPANMIEQWKADVKRTLNLTVEYSAVGSGGGRSQFIAATVDFGASDVPLTAAETAQANEKHGSFLTIPVTAGGIAVEYRLDGASSIRLTPATIAKIFKGSIKKWDDPAITADNGIALPGKDIVVYVRSDRSGTSEVFTDYLSKAAPADWTTGANGNFPTTGGQIGRSGSDGVSNAVQGQDGSIGYSELSFAVERNLGVVRVRNAAGQFKSPADSGAVAEAIDDATVKPDGTLTLNYLTTNPSAYPISTTSYVLAATKMDAKKGDNLRAFLDYALGEGQSKAPALSYSPLPARLATSGRQKAASINASTANVPTSTNPTGATTTSNPTGSTTSTTSSATGTTATTVAPSSVSAASTTGSSGGSSSGGGTAARSSGGAAATGAGAVAKTGGEHLAWLIAGLTTAGVGAALRRRQRSVVAG